MSIVLTIDVCMYVAMYMLSTSEIIHTAVCSVVKIAGHAKLHMLFT